MRIAYVDTSYLVAILLEEEDHPGLRTELESFDELFSSNLLEAELRSALRREGIDETPDEILSELSWIQPDRPLTEEFTQVLGHGYLRGADLWHVGCALYLRRQVGDLGFLSLDQRQLEVARALLRSQGHQAT